MSKIDKIVDKDENEKKAPERAKLAFVAYRGIMYALYLLVATVMLNGGAGAVVKWMIYSGFEFVDMSTFGVGIVGFGMLLMLRMVQYGTDKLFVTQFGITTSTKKK